MRWLICFLLLAAGASAAPETYRVAVPSKTSNRERNAVLAAVPGPRLFDVRVRAFVVDEFGEQGVRVRAQIKNLTGPRAYFSAHCALLDGAGHLLGAGGHNDVYHEKKQGEDYTEQWLVRMTPAEVKKLRSLQLVFYEDTAFLGKR